MVYSAAGFSEDFGSSSEYIEYIVTVSVIVPDLLSPKAAIPFPLQSHQNLVD